MGNSRTMMFELFFDLLLGLLLAKTVKWAVPSLITLLTHYVERPTLRALQNKFLTKTRSATSPVVPSVQTTPKLIQKHASSSGRKGQLSFAVADAPRTLEVEPTYSPRASLSFRKKRWLFALYLLFVTAYSVRFGAFAARSNNSWLIGDWLINYSAGFVRRGLTGALVLLLHRATGFPLEWVVFSIQTSVFLLFIACVYKLSIGIRWSYLMAAVLLSPATVAFTVLDQGAGFRKETLLFAALAFTLCILVYGHLKDWQLSTVLSVLLLGLALSHEGLLVATPYFFAAVLLQTRNLRRATFICAVPVALSCIALVAVMQHHGNLAVTQTICSSVGGHMGQPGVVLENGGICDGSIAAMQLNYSVARAQIVFPIRQFHMVRLFSLLAIPVFAPLVALISLFYRRDRLRFEIITLVICAIVSLAGTGVLFYIGLDWGRWIHLQAMCLMLLAMMIDRKAAASFPVAAFAKLYLHGPQFRFIATIALVLYATIWTLPAVGVAGETRGYVPMLWQSHFKLHHLGLAIVDHLIQIK